MANKQTQTAAFIVRAARGHERPDGGIAYSGMLWKGDEQVATFHNDGNGGCNSWGYINVALFNEFVAAAKAKFSSLSFEHEDHYVGELWDAAYSTGLTG